ncbi:MAG: hypothetical protein IT454_16680 [Planctomycetes bacterium]|nr:hypothetical protein [Planctomycetota bacterium]
MDLSSPPLHLVLGLLIAPALIASVVMLLSVRKSALRDLGRFGALALGLGYVAGHRASLTEWPAFPPAASGEALLYAGALAGLGGLIAGSVAHRRVALLIVGLFHLGACWLVLRNVLLAMPVHEMLAFSGVALVLPSSVAVLFDRFAERERGPVAPLVLWMCASAGAGAIALTGSVIFAQFSASLAAVLGAALALCVLVRDVSFARGLTLAALPHAALLAIAAANLSELPQPAVLLLTIAPLAVFAVPAATLRRVSTPWRVLIPSLLVALPLVAALVVCWLEHAQSANAYS